MLPSIDGEAAIKKEEDDYDDGQETTVGRETKMTLRLGAKVKA